MFGLVLQLIVVAVIIQQGLVFLGKKKIKAERRREEIRRLVRLAKSEAAIVESERQRITDGACSVCYYAPTTIRCSCCKVTRYCSGKCQIIHWRQGHRDECVETNGNHCQQAETNYKEDEPKTDKQPPVPDAITNNSSNSFSFTLEDFLGFASGWMDESKEGVGGGERPHEIAQSRNGWMKAMRELEEERELVKLMKMECDEIRQSFMSQVEKKEHELLSALNGAAASAAYAICLTNKNGVAFGCRHMSDCAKAIKELTEGKEQVLELKLEVEKITTSMRKLGEIRFA
ncbi:hypothetical protein K1719_023010 [Acacia pycnantha]|nr:hypothetical protein K1719_023010 [Acacia pycnantha]